MTHPVSALDSTKKKSFLADEDDRKIFVGGLPPKTGEEDIRQHFSQASSYTEWGGLSFARF